MTPDAATPGPPPAPAGRGLAPLLGALLLLVTSGLVLELVREQFSPLVAGGVTADPAARRPPLTRRVVIVLVDSLRYDTAADPELFPTLAALRPRGAWGVALTGDISMTGLSVRTIGTSSTPALGDVARNFDMPPVRFETVFDLLVARGGRIALAGDKNWQQIFGDRLASAYVGLHAPGMGDIDDSDRRYLARLDPALAPPEIAAELGAARGLLVPPLDWELLIVHFVGLDNAAHRWGVPDERFRAKARRVDDALAAIVARLPADATLMVVSDHGCTDAGRHGSQEEIARVTPLFLMGPGIRAGVDDLEVSLFDYAPTLSALLGLPLAAPVEGRVIDEALALDEAARADWAVLELENRVRYLAAWRREFARELPLPAREVAALRAEVDAGAADPRELRGRARALGARLNAEAAEAAQGSPAGLLAWLAALALVVVAAALRLGPAAGAPPRGTRRLAAVALVALAAAAALGWTLVFLPVAAAALAAMTLRLAPPGARWRSRAAVVVLGGLAAWEVVVAAAFLYEHRVHGWLADHLGKLAEPLYFGVLWLALVAAALAAVRRRVHRSDLVRQHPMLAATALVVLLASLDGYYQVLRYALVGMGFVVVAHLDHGRLGGASSGRARLSLVASLAFLAFLLAWVATFKPLLFGVDIRRFDVPAMTLVSLVTVAGFAGWFVVHRRLARSGPLGLALVLLALPFGLRVAPAPGLLVGSILAHAALLAWIGLPGRHAAERADLLQLAALSLYLLLCFNRELQVLLVVATTAIMIRVFDAPRWAQGGLAGAFAVGVGVLVFRVILFGAFEQKLDFTSIEVTAGFMGGRELDLGYTISMIALKFAAPFLLVLAIATRRLAPPAFAQVALVVVILLGARVLHIVTLVLFTQDQFHAMWHLIGELFFYAAFVASFGGAAAIAALVRAPAPRAA